MRLKELRIEKGLTQWDVANGIGTGQSNIGRWERGEVLPTADFIIKIADFFHVSIDFLLERADDFGNIAIQNEKVKITSQENDLLNYFRSLSPYLKGVALDSVRAMAGGNSSGSLQNKA